MKKYHLLLVSVLALTACDRDNLSPDEPSGAYLAIPYSVQDSMFVYNPGQSNPGIKLYGVAGYLLAGIRSGNIIDTAGQLASYRRSLQIAQFIDTTGAWVTPDSVALNNRQLWPLTNGASQEICMFSAAFPDLWNNTGSNHWQVAGNSDVPAINTSITLPFPQFDTDLPDSFNIHQPFSFTFSSSNLQGADSALILVYSYSGHIWASQVVRADGGTATVDCSPSATNNNSPLNMFFNVDGKIYHGGILALIAYRTEIHTTGGKNFAYVVEAQKVQKVLFH